MMKAKKVLFVTQEITPYVSDSEMARMGRNLPQAVQDDGHEIRTFMPKWGIVNERRNQLHEVIRLSGMNLIIDDTDHPLIIKVASIQAARMQVYFIDNDDYFQKRKMTVDEKGEDYEDNDERAIFYARGVLETMKKLRWAPDVVHCQGWMSAFLPMYLRKVYSDEPVFKNCKIIYSLFGSSFTKPFGERLVDKLVMRGIERNEIQDIIKAPFDYPEMCKLAISYSDGVIQNSESVDQRAIEFAKQKGVPVLEYQSEDKYVSAFENFYEQVCGAKPKEK
ncbi:MAG: glycogen/starch synthase [Phocaeicola sp.]|uniref:glycogen/starch synthase n=1 Tax=Phocaeicola TaxID=909656 RepID=UPI00234F668F|nr:glycogen/starch synthase [Phocaeicola oris]MCE2615622.1 glycogen/starch synthase [Phocaeicola oris]